MVKWRYGLREVDENPIWLEVVEVYQNDDSGDEWLTQTDGLGYASDIRFVSADPKNIITMLENAIKDIKRERGLE